ncbi:MAG: hypothetical protein HFJ95_05990 [Muribaculaceae bacterium]|nr:hypothetical protein [Muribaculaceae bacterium]
MEDDKLRELFSNFQPELSPSFQFTTKLQKKMEAVEIVKQHNATLRKRNRLAVAIAALCGFIMNMVLYLIFPLINNSASSLSIPSPYLLLNSITIDSSFVVWIVMAVISVIITRNVYEIALSKFLLYLHN